MITVGWIANLCGWFAFRPGFVRVLDLRVRVGDGDVDPFCTSVSVEDARARACRCDARACPGVCVRERVISRTPEEWEYSDPITGIGLGVLPVRPYTPRRSFLTTTPPLVPRVPPSTTWSLASGHSRGLANAGNNPTSALEVCGITILGRRPGDTRMRFGGTRMRLEWRSQAL